MCTSSKALERVRQGKVHSGKVVGEGVPARIGSQGIINKNKIYHTTRVPIPVLPLALPLPLPLPYPVPFLQYTAAAAAAHFVFMCHYTEK